VKAKNRNAEQIAYESEDLICSEDIYDMTHAQDPKEIDFYIPNNGLYSQPDGQDRKFRYGKVKCVKESNVKLKSGNFIHANYIGHGKFGGFIAAQGPLLNTIDDFFDMLKEKNCKIVLMLTKPFENGDEKCTNYYDESNQWYSNPCSKYYLLNSDEFNSTKINPLYEKLNIKGLTKRDLRFRERSTGRSYNLMHFLYEIWPDHQSLDVIKLYDLVKGLDEIFSEAKTNKEKIVVHCSAGIGRTGTFIAAFDIFKKFENAVIKKMPSENSFIEGRDQYRQYRYGFIQTNDQLNSIMELNKMLLILDLTITIDHVKDAFDQDGLALDLLRREIFKTCLQQTKSDFLRK